MSDLVYDASEREIIEQLRTVASKWSWHTGVGRSYLFLGKLYVGMVRQYPGLKSYKASWGAWLMTDDQGESVGWHATESEARAALEQAAKRAVGGE